MRFSNDFATMSLLRNRRRRLRDFSCIPWLPPPLERRTRPVPEIRKRLAAARLVFILGTVGSLPRARGLLRTGAHIEPRVEALQCPRRSGGRIFEAVAPHRQGEKRGS